MNSRSERALAADFGSLLAICLLSSVTYLGGLGFYSDDWGILHEFDSMWTAGINLARLFSDFNPRPLQGVYIATLYASFGHAALGYHAVNTLLLAVSICLLHLFLVQLGVGRSMAFAASAVTAVLPQLSTIRVWIASDQITLSMALALVSLICHLRFVRARKAGWLLASVFTALLCVAAYEIFAPFIVLFGAVYALVDIRSGRPARQPILGLLPALSLALAGIVKGAVSNRLETRPGAYLVEARTFFRSGYDWRHDYGLNLFAALDVHYPATIAAWTREFVEIFAGRVGVSVLIAASAAGALTFWRIARANRRDRAPLWILFVLGLTTWVFGHGVFLVTEEIMFSPSGIANRVLVAAAIGVGMILVAFIACMAGVLPDHLRLPSFAFVIAFVVFVGTAQIARAASYWVDAAVAQKRFLSTARADLYRLPTGSIVIVDGLCPYDGPAIVLEAYWDTGGALSHALGRDVRADVVSPRMFLREKGFATSIYGFRSFYPYSPGLYVYDPRVRRVTGLPDAASARRYFQHSARRPLRCPEGYVGQGVLI